VTANISGKTAIVRFYDMNDTFPQIRTVIGATAPVANNAAINNESSSTLYLRAALMRTKTNGFSQICIINGDLYIAGNTTHVIHKCNKDLLSTEKVIGIENTPGLSDTIPPLTTFNLPTAICSDGTYLYIGESGNGTIRKLHLVTKQSQTLSGIANNSIQKDTALH
jgi:hypothetical protein